MLTRTVSLIVIVCTLLAQCKKVDEVEIPPCIQLKIDSIKKLPKATPPVQVNVWDYQGRRVYLFSAACCDELVRVYDGECRYVCAPSGGVNGFGDSTCTDFYQSAQHRALIWKDDR